MGRRGEEGLKGEGDVNAGRMKGEGSFLPFS